MSFRKNDPADRRVTSNRTRSSLARLMASTNQPMRAIPGSAFRFRQAVSRALQ